MDGHNVIFNAPLLFVFVCTVQCRSANAHAQNYHGYVYRIPNSAP